MEQIIGGSYQILDKLGSGGMGEVYRARDTRLNRTVALKVLRADFADPDRQRRFIQEAQAASGLNHPNIITIHDIIHHDGNDVMVMEYVAGKTLGDMIPPGGLRVPQVINYGMQIADALAAAHAAGIIHRDLKPGNIMVTEKGLVKLLDFGLAKIALPSSDDPDATDVIRPMTVVGAIVGTLSYMSPEQAQGKKLDPRSDIFSFGAVLYEMATGCRAFSGDNSATTLSAVLRDDPPPMAQTTPDVPPQLEGVISRCLRKNPDERYQTMQAVHDALRDLKRVSDSGILYRSQISVEPPTAIGPPPSRISSSSASLPSIPPPVAGQVNPPPVGRIIGGTVLAIALAGAGLFWYRSSHAKPETPRNLPPVAETAIQAAIEAATKGHVEALDNDAIVEMTKAHVPKSLIVSQIRSAKKRDFDLSPGEVIKLVRSGVSEDVIEAMRNPEAAGAPVHPTPGAAVPKSAPQQSGNAAGPAAITPPVPPPAPGATESAAPIPGKPLRTVDGVPFMLVLAEDVPRDAEEGTPIHFTTSADVKVGDTVVIPKGARALGEVHSASKKKMFGRDSKVIYRLIEATSVNGTPLKIRSTPSAREADSGGRPLDPAGNKSKEIAAPKGTQVPAYLVGDQPLAR